MSRPLEALALRVEALERRLDTLEALLRHSQARLEPGELGMTTADAGSATVPVTNAEVQQLFAQLAYDTARLVRSMAFPQSPDLEPSRATASPEDEDRSTSESMLPDRTGT